MVVRLSLVKVMVRTASVAALRTPGAGHVQLHQRRHLGVQRVEGDLELDPLDQTVRHRVVLVVDGAQGVQQGEVAGVERLAGQLGFAVGV